MNHAAAASKPGLGMVSRTSLISQFTPLEIAMEGKSLSPYSPTLGSVASTPHTIEARHAHLNHSGWVRPARRGRFKTPHDAEERRGRGCEIVASLRGMEAEAKPVVQLQACGISRNKCAGPGRSSAGKVRQGRGGGAV